MKFNQTFAPVGFAARLLAYPATAGASERSRRGNLFSAMPDIDPDDDNTIPAFAVEATRKWHPAPLTPQELHDVRVWARKQKPNAHASVFMVRRLITTIDVARRGK